jgi:biotin carboxyl carrier protein
VTVHVEAGGRRRAVDVRRDGDRFLVSLDGRQHAVDVKVINGVWSMLVEPARGPMTGPAEAGPSDRDDEGTGFPNNVGADGPDNVGADGPNNVRADGPNNVGAGFSRPARSYEIAFSPSAEGVLTVHVDGVPVEVSINQMRRAGAAAAHSADGGPQRVTAPMPGKIVKLLVKPGEKVQARQGVIVVEAMKMENELRAHAAGTVSEVRVTEGTSVEAGAILVILE